MISNSEIINIFKEIEGSDDDNRSNKIKGSIVEKMSFLVYKNAKKYKKYPNYEDVVQDGFVGLIKATNRFDYKRFPNFFVFAEQWINHSIMRSASRFDVVYSPSKIRVVYSEPDENEFDPKDLPENMYLEAEIHENIKNCIESFSSKEKYIISKVFGLDGPEQSLRQIAPQIGITHERVRQIKNSAISKIKRNILNKYGEF